MRSTTRATSRKKRRATTAATWPSCVRRPPVRAWCWGPPRPASKAGITPSAASTQFAVQVDIGLPVDAAEMQPRVAAGWRGPLWARSDELVPVPEIRVEERIRDGVDVVAVIRIGNRSIVPITGEHGGGDGGHQPVLILEAGPGERRAVGRNQRIALDSPGAAG